MASRIAVAVGVGLVLLGASLPWIVHNPAFEQVLLVKKMGMGSGLETYGLVTFVLGILAAVGLLVGGRWIRTDAYRAALGAVGIGLSAALREFILVRHVVNRFTNGLNRKV